VSARYSAEPRTHLTSLGSESDAAGAGCGAGGELRGDAHAAVLASSASAHAENACIR
jgi:hypothetical protein